ncbi:hypothetical protein Zmor_023529 [Zophobas morio]|uniref:Uncharacterized protein n=1 Tax=Zophobas morio TaxID=2755281 RepID=A0AA38M7H0_9CUCU|nr:hypothetical protein Zmor_023529 [Zophobas morio]
MGSRAFFYGDNDASWMASPKQRSHKDKSRSELAMDTRERSRSEKYGFKSLMGLNRGDRRERIHSASEVSQERPVKFAGIISVHIRCNSSSCKYQLLRNKLLSFTYARLIIRPSNVIVPFHRS